MPKINAFRTFPYTAQVHNYRLESDGATPGNTKVYSFHKDVKVDLTTASYGRATVFFDEDGFDILPEARLHELKDRQGNELYPGGIWTLTGIMPNVTIGGTREGFTAEVYLTHETEAL